MRPRKRWRVMLVPAILLLLIVAVAVFPPSFQFLVRTALVWQASHHGIGLKIENIEGSIFEPLVLSHIEASSTSSMGTATKISVARADAGFSWKSLFLRRGTKWFKRLRVDGFEGDLRFYAPKPGTEQSAPEFSNEPAAPQRGWLEKFMPSQIEVRHANFAFGHEDGALRVNGLAFTASGTGPGTVEIERVEIDEPWLKKTFAGVRGTTALQDSKLAIAGLALDSGLTIQTFSTDLAGITDGGAKMDFNLAAFGGSIRCELQNRGRIRGHLNFEASGKFAQIGVPKIGKFFNTKEKTSGTIKEGTFSFQGSPRDIPHATLMLQAEAADFQWGERKWTSLQGGATLVSNRVQIPELHLKQLENELNLSGEMAVPTAQSKWWQQEFAFNIAAKIDNLSDLSPLLGPGMALLGKKLENMAGRAAIDGSVRGQNSSFAGQLIVSGSQLWYGSAPLDELHASIKLDGGKWQFTNLEFIHGDDYFRGNGVVEPVFGDTLDVKSYAGRLRASVGNLSLYWPLLEPFVSWCEGGLVLDWSGESTPKSSDGFVHAQLKNFRSIDAPHPINADLEATYAPQKITFSNFAVSDDDSSFTAKVTAGPKMTRVESIRLLQKNNVALEGSATLPLDLWSAWQSGEWIGALDFSGACKAMLNANRLQLHDALVLTGQQFPVKGFIDGSLAADGTPANLALSGKVAVEHTQIPLGDGLPLLEEIAANLTLSGQDITIVNGSARVASGAADFDGTVGVKNVRNPNLKLHARVESRHIFLPLGPRADLIPDFHVNINGPLSEANVTGVARSLNAQSAPTPNLAALLSPSADVLPLAIGPAPFGDWKFNVEWKDLDAPDFLTEETFASQPFTSRDLRVTGRGRLLRLAGDFAQAHVSISTPFARFTIENGAIQFPIAGDPVLNICGSGSAPGCVFHAVVTGPQHRKQIFVWSEPPMPPAALIELITKGTKPPQNPPIVKAAPPAPPVQAKPAVPAAAAPAVPAK